MLQELQAKGGEIEMKINGKTMKRVNKFSYLDRKDGSKYIKTELILGGGNDIVWLGS